MSDLPPHVEIDGYMGGPYVWNDVWHYHPEQTNPVRGAADFYLLQAVKSGSTEETLPKIFAYEAEHLFNPLVWKLDQEFLRYSLMAVGGEARYTRLGGVHLSKERALAWIGFKTAYDMLGSTVLSEIAWLFDAMPNTSVAGPSWARAARLVHQRVTRKFSPEVFVDSVIGLQHNTGVFLNKVPWKTGDLSVIKSEIGPATMQRQTDWRVLRKYASPRVAKLFSDYQGTMRKVGMAV